jgi:hypothetical protein
MGRRYFCLFDFAFLIPAFLSRQEDEGSKFYTGGVNRLRAEGRVPGCRHPSQAAKKPR